METEDLRDRVGMIEDAQDRVETHLPLATYQVDLIQPSLGVPDADVPAYKRIFARRTFTSTFPGDESRFERSAVRHRAARGAMFFARCRGAMSWFLPNESGTVIRAFRADKHSWS